MNTSFQVMCVVLLAGIVALGSNVPLASAWDKHVRFEGALYPLDQEGAVCNRLDTIKVRVGEKELFLNVADVRDLSGYRSGLTILQSIFPQTLVVRGPSNLLETMQNAEMVGQPIKIEGYLYNSVGLLNVFSIEKLDSCKA